MSVFDNMYDDDAQSLNRKIYGVCVGIVTNNKDPEKLGRVKVKLPIRECVNETAWARVASIMAGKEMGAFFLPEVGDEVLVAFGEGDVTKPYIIGALWNSIDKPPQTNDDGKNNFRQIKSRNGNTILINDEAGKEYIEIKTKAGQVVKLQDDASGKIEIKDSGGKNLMTIDAAANEVTLKADMKISLKAQGCKIMIDASQNSINIESAMQLNLKAQMIKIEAGASLDIKSDGILNIKGSMVKIN